ncbi:2-(5''-triphosphoribosyl)-3'-dephosphocoenzyme-A synthase [subsurface metagenome]
MIPIKLNKILKAKEKRFFIQRSLIKKYKNPIICLTLNIPGEKKNGELFYWTYLQSLKELRKKLEQSGFTIKFQIERITDAGPEAFLVIQGNVLELKRLSVIIEEKNPLGRLLDIDVYNENHQPLSRAAVSGKKRTCIICGRGATECIIERKHSTNEILERMKERIVKYKHNIKISEIIGENAQKAMFYELAVTPKPGLVDLRNCGSHSDMDLLSFIKSSFTLSPYFGFFAECGLNAANLNSLLKKLRKIGNEAEKKMFDTTDGINTQKGLLFSIGIIAGAAGFLLKDNSSIVADDIVRTVTSMAKNLIDYELYSIKSGLINPHSNGEKIYARYGISGIRGEVSNGFPSVMERGLPALRESLSKQKALNDSLVHVLIHIMICLDDTNVIHRGGIESLKLVQKRAWEILACGSIFTQKGKNKILETDSEFIKKNISPGGSADLLAVTFFIYLLETSFKDH